MEWIDPRYAEVVEAMKPAQTARDESPEGDPIPMRGFIIPPSPSDGR